MPRPRARRIAHRNPIVGDPGEPDKRRAILHAAVRVFAEKGYHGCRIADVARQADVAYGLVYHYFKNKDELLESVFAEQWTIFINALRAISEGPGTAAEHLAAVCRFVLDVYLNAPAAVRVLILEVARTPGSLRAGSTRQTFEAALDLVAGMVRRGQEAGELRPGIDPRLGAACLLGALELCLTGMVVGIIGSTTPSDEELEKMQRDITDVALSGLRASGAAGTS